MGALGAGLVAGSLVAIAVFGHLKNPGFVENLLVTVVAEGLLATFAIWCLPKVARMSLRSLGLRVPTLKAVGIAIVGAPCAVVGASIVSAIVKHYTHAPHPQASVVAFAQGAHPLGQSIFVFLGACAVAPIAEESIFRWFAFNLGLRYGGFWIGAIGSGVLFGLAHMDLYNAPALAVVGVVLCAVYYLSRNAFASAITHGLFNAITLAVVLIDPSVVTR